MPPRIDRRAEDSTRSGPSSPFQVVLLMTITSKSKWLPATLLCVSATGHGVWLHAAQRVEPLEDLRRYVQRFTGPDRLDCGLHVLTKRDGQWTARRRSGAEQASGLRNGRDV